MHSVDRDKRTQQEQHLPEVSDLDLVCRVVDEVDESELLLTKCLIQVLNNDLLDLDALMTISFEMKLKIVGSLVDLSEAACETQRSPIKALLEATLFCWLQWTAATECFSKKGFSFDPNGSGYVQRVGRSLASQTSKLRAALTTYLIETA